MTKISVTGSKEHLEDVIEELHNLQLMDINQYEGELDTGEPVSEAEDLSELLVDVRSLLSKMPELEVENEEVRIGEVQKDIRQVKEEIEGLNQQEEELEREIEQTREKKQFFKKLKETKLEINNLKPSETLDVFIGKLDASKFEANVGVDDYQLFHSKSADVVVYSKRKADRIETALEEAARDRFKLPKTNFSGTCQEVYKKLDKKLSRLEDRCSEIETKEASIAEEWRGKLVYLETYLTEKIEKAEAPIKFATTQRTFTAKGWIPTDSFEKIEERLAEVSKGKIHIEKAQQDEKEQIPVKHENNRAVKPFESLTDLVSVPRYNELDPSFILLLTFPLFFGFMIGDAGYGITTGIVFLAGMKKFPQAAKIFKALMWTSASTVIFGLLYGEMFGTQIYQSPFYRGDLWTPFFYLSIAIGIAHINLGLLIGAYNEYKQHGLMEAIFAKLSWILLQVAAVAGYFTFTNYGTVPGALVGIGIATPTLIMLLKGEGVEGIVEIPSLISNILSYARLFGVSVAAYSLAGTVNAIADPAMSSGSLLGIALGTTVLLFGHTLLTFLKIMEGFLQGIRLHYVEMFGWFYEGGGKKYAPFGAKQS